MTITIRPVLLRSIQIVVQDRIFRLWECRRVRQNFDVTDAEGVKLLVRTKRSGTLSDDGQRQLRKNLTRRMCRLQLCLHKPNIQSISGVRVHKVTRIEMHLAICSDLDRYLSN